MKSAHPPLSVNVRFSPPQNQRIRDKTSKSCRKYVVVRILLNMKVILQHIADRELRSLIAPACTHLS